MLEMLVGAAIMIVGVIVGASIRDFGSKHD